MRISLAKREESIYGLAARTVVVCITAQAGRCVTHHAVCRSSAMVGYGAVGFCVVGKPWFAPNPPY